MRIVDFAELHKMDFTISKIAPLRQYWANWSSFTYKERPKCGLIYLSNCEVDYDVKDHPDCSAKRGDIVYAPKKSFYISRFKNSTSDSVNESNFLINFELYDEHGNPFILGSTIKIITPASSSYYHRSFQQIVSLFYNNNTATSRIKALLYNLLTDLSLEFHKKKITAQHYASIHKGIMYLEQNLNSNVSISELAAMCHVSETCFRRLFKEYSGMSPKQYVIHHKISKAQMLLESGSASVADVAAFLGFDDPSYFSRLYKKKTGHAPRSAVK